MFHFIIIFYIIIGCQSENVFLTGDDENLGLVYCTMDKDPLYQMATVMHCQTGISTKGFVACERSLYFWHEDSGSSKGVGTFDVNSLSDCSVATYQHNSVQENICGNYTYQIKNIIWLSSSGPGTGFKPYCSLTPNATCEDSCINGSTENYINSFWNINIFYSCIIVIIILFQ